MFDRENIETQNADKCDLQVSSKILEFKRAF